MRARTSGGWTISLLTRLRYLDMFRDGSIKSWRSCSETNNIDTRAHTGANHDARFFAFVYKISTSHAHEPARTHLEHLEVLGAEAVPGLAQARHAAVAEPADDGEHGVEVLGVLAVPRHFDEVLEQLGALDDRRLAHHLAHHPEHLAVHQLETHTDITA